MTNHYADAIAISIWEISTGNGRDLDRDLWDSHIQNCDTAASLNRNGTPPRLPEFSEASVITTGDTPWHV